MPLAPTDTTARTARTRQPLLIENTTPSLFREIVAKEPKPCTARVYVGDCRDILPKIPEVRAGELDAVFADPPFNWNRAYDKWDDAMPEAAYLAFTFDWLDLCINGLRPGGSLWVNIPDTWAAEIACYVKGRGVLVPGTKTVRNAPSPMHLANWCVWHYRFGQNATEKFINSKVHVFHFVKAGGVSTWNPLDIAEMSDRKAIYGDRRTLSKKDGMPPGMRVPMDVWYGQHFSRVQGNNLERRGYHDNQLPELYLARVIRATSKPGDMVLDPFLGSGTTGVVAHALGRNFIGTEFSKENAQSACDRIARGPVRDVAAPPGLSASAIFDTRAGRDIGEMPPEPKPRRAKKN